MDSGEINKILAGVLGAVLAFLLLGFFSDLIYFGPGGHEDEDRTLAFAVEVEDSGGGEAEEVIDYGALLASADASSGASVFNKCKACHNLDGTNAVGPHLDGVVGRDIAGVEGFAYSDALMGKEGAWDLENLFHFIHNPSGWAPGTKMGFAGLSDNQDKVDLIVYLNEQGGSPVELVAPEMPETAEGGAAEEGAEGEASAEGGGHAELIAAADPDAGANVFKKCQACHKVDGTNGVGPHLDGVVGRDIAGVEDFNYSDALSSKEGSWDFDHLFNFLHDPQGWAPGTSMGFAGLQDEQDRANVIAYLNQQGDSPVDLGGGAAEGGEAAQGEEPAAEAGGEEASAAAEGSGEASAEGEGSDQASAEAEAGDGTTAEGGSGEEAAAEAEQGGEASAAGGEGEEATAEAGGGGQAGLMAAADADAGEKVFRKCQACHRLEEGKNLIGPYLYGVVGRDIASVDGFNYSDALSSKDGSWDAETLAAFLHDPQGWAPGTIMGFAGLEDEQDRADVIAYMNQHSDSPVEFAAAAGGEGGEAGTDEASAPGTEEGGEAAAEGEEAGTAAGDGEEEAAASDGGDAAAEGDTADASEPGSAAQAEPEELVDAEVETSAEVEANPSSALTEITDEERVEPLPGTEESTDETAEAGEEATSEEAAAGGSGDDGDVVALLASADIDAGEQVFRKCSACHRLEEGKNTIGPHLYGVVGRAIASVESYSYSDALSSKEGSWDPANLSAFLTDPSGWAPGTKMGFAGLDDAQDRANLIAYLNQASDAPMEFGAAPAPVRHAAAGLDGVRLASLGFVGLSETATEAAAAAELGEAAEERSDTAAEVAEGAEALAEDAAEQAAGAAEEASAVAETAGPAAPTTGTPAGVPEAAERVAAAADALTAVMDELAQAARAGTTAADATQ